MEIAPTMAPSHNHQGSWDSLSSTFAHLDVSFSQDSCYGSDEVSVSSNNTAPLQSSVSTCIATREEPSLHPFLKSILKKPTAVLDEEEDTASESGYGSDDIGLDYDALSDDEDEDDDMSDFSVWDEEAPDDVLETQGDRTDLFDDSFIGFEPAVRFDPKIEYIDTSDAKQAEDEPESNSEMTAHEMMLLAQKSGSLQGSWQSDADDASDDECEPACEALFRSNAPQLEDFTRDAVEVDQRLFIAYMNGIHGIADSNYKTYLRAQADNIRLGHETESMHPDDPPCMYLDLVLNHVIGVFRNLLAADELDDLIALRKEDATIEPVESSDEDATSPDTDKHQALLDKIEHFLLNRLTNGSVDVLPDELSFFAGGIAHALGTQDLPAIV